MLAEIKGLNEECGVFGIWGHEEARKSRITVSTAFSTEDRRVRAS